MQQHDGYMIVKNCTSACKKPTRMRVTSCDKQLNIQGGHYSIIDGADEELGTFSDKKDLTFSDRHQEVTIIICKCFKSSFEWFLE